MCVCVCVCVCERERERESPNCEMCNDLVLLAKEEAVLQGMTDMPIGIGKYYGMQKNVENNQGHENLKATSTSTDYDRLKPLKNVDYFNYLGIMMQDVHVKLYPGLPYHSKSSIQQED